MPNWAQITLFSSETSTGLSKSINLIEEYARTSNDVASGLIGDFTAVALLSGTANATAVAYDLEGSLDNENWFRLVEYTFNTTETTSGQSMIHVKDKPVAHLRANLTKLDGGTAPAFTLNILGAN